MALTSLVFAALDKKNEGREDVMKFVASDPPPVFQLYHCWRAA